MRVCRRANEPENKFTNLAARKTWPTQLGALWKKRRRTVFLGMNRAASVFLMDRHLPSIPCPVHFAGTRQGASHV
jgi:hypothetical protein